MRVIALKTGYDGLMVREPDRYDDEGKPVVFDMPDGAQADWFVEVDDAGKPVTPTPPKPAKKSGREAVPGQGPARGSQVADGSVNKAGAFQDPTLNTIA